MDDVLLSLILERLDQVELAEDATDLLLAACDGDDALEDHLGGAPAPRPERTAISETGTGEPAGAFLESISVAGFRGVGPECTLPIPTGPGLTLVVGRNGSGKSSFAEGLEVLLTGDLRRWQERSAIWRESWRNLHSSDTTSVEAQLVLEDGGPTTLSRTWKPGASFEDGEATMQIKGRKREDLTALGWDSDLLTYRPLLSHAELEAFFGKPSELYELLSSVLGLEDLTSTVGRLAEARKQRDGRLAVAKKSLPGLLERLDGLDDDRARRCAEALRARPWDLETAMSVATGTDPSGPDRDLEWLRRACQLNAPTAEVAGQAAGNLRAAAEAVATTRNSEAGRARQLADLLDAALAHTDHDRDGTSEGDCPVCGTTAVIDDAWRQRASDQVVRLRTDAKAAEEAERTADAARRVIAGLVSPPPPWLTAHVPAGIDTARTVGAWTEWARLPEGDGPEHFVEVATHLEATASELSEAVSELVSSSRAALQEREDRWAPLATELAVWCEQADSALVGAEVVPAIKKAEAWLKAANEDIRNARLSPIAEQARAVWQELRQESNVELHEIRLTGAANRRALEIDVSVDGSEGAALGVMSQGEVNALALSIFLPRATMSASPFRFLVIDDPVQAMDPAKVDGFARVMHTYSSHRQVVVFTHDDRLPEAVRRLDIPATVLEVTRQAGSVVEVRHTGDPADRAIDDALALAADDSVPHKVAAQIVPGLCRIAIEAALTAAIRRQQLRKGMRHAEVEVGLEKAQRLTDRAALALFEDSTKGGHVLSRLNGWDRRCADTYQALNKGAHTGHPGELRDLIANTKFFVKEVRTNLP